MAIVVNDRERIGEEKLGVLFDGGKVRRRREWRGLRDTLYDYGRWLYIPYRSSPGSSQSRAT